MKNLLFLFVITATTAVFAAGKDPINSNWRGLAIDGYDVVAYFTKGKPTKGSSDFETTYQEATWRFESQANLDAFKSNPDRYIPQYGGYCAWAVSQGTTADTNPNNWKIVDDKLYLNYNTKIQKKWEADIPGFIEAANANWPSVLEN